MDDVSSRILNYIEDRLGKMVTKDRDNVLKQIGRLMTTPTSKVCGTRPPTAWVLFARERRPILRASNPELNGHQITKLIGSEWSATIGTPTRQEYERRSAAMFRQSDAETVSEDKARCTSPDRSSEGQDTGQESDTSDPDPQDIFLTFCQTVQRKHPDMSERRLNKITRQAWDLGIRIQDLS